MAKKNLNKIFLSASIPYADRDKKYFDTADVVAIRDSVRALAAVVIPKAHLVWGGHPSITPLIRYVMDRMGARVQDHITLYQSLFFEDKFPNDNFAFEKIVLTPRMNGVKESLEIMRKTLMEQNYFRAGIFVGGMEGIEEEYELFIKHNPNAIVLPIASTGAAAKFLYQANPRNYNSRLLNDYAYMALFSDFLNDYLI